MTKTEIREQVFILLFQTDYHDRESLSQQAEDYLQTLEDAGKKDLRQINDKYHGVMEHLEKLDDYITRYSRGWEISRLAKADVANLRVAVYEMLYDEKVPVGVAINEAVELAKTYGTENSPAFVNGLLGNVAREQETEA